MLAETRVETQTRSAEQELAPAAPIRGRSLWQDAGARFQRNRAALVSLIVLIAIVVFSFVGSFVVAWSFVKFDWGILGMVAQKGQPSLANGHYFGVDEVGRDLYSRVIQGTQISLAVGILGSAVAVIMGTLYGAIAGYFGGRLDSAMMRFVDIIYSIPFLFILILMMIMFGRSFVVLFMGIGLISWLGLLCVVRGLLFLFVFF